MAAAADDEDVVREIAALLSCVDADDRRRELCERALALASNAAAAPDASTPCEAFGLARLSIDALLAELEIGGKYAATFEEYELSTVSELLSVGGPDECSAFLASLGVTPNDQHRIVTFAYSHRPNMTSGSIYSPRFLRAARPLYSMHMGCENMGPLLYHLARFAKARTVLEIGAGYTSLWLLQALADNAEELRNYEQLLNEGSAAQWLVEERVREPRGPPVLHCVDNLAHAQTTAHRVLAAARALGIDQLLRVHEADAWQLAGSWAEATAAAGAEGAAAEGDLLDLLWLDFGAGTRLSSFLGAWWPRVAPGGFVVVHSTLTNALTRSWLESVRAPPGGGGGDEAAGAGAPATESAPARSLLGDIATLSLLEPHKRYQNSCTIIQKRADGYAEPIYSLYP